MVDKCIGRNDKLKIRIEGDETKTGSVLSNLQRVLTADFKKSSTKLKEMEARLSTGGLPAGHNPNSKSRTYRF